MSCTVTNPAVRNRETFCVAFRKYCVVFAKSCCVLVKLCCVLQILFCVSIILCCVSIIVCCVQIILCCVSIMHQSIPPAPSPPPGLLRGIYPPCQSRGWGICKFCTARGPGICQPPGHSRAFDTHAVSYQNITTQKVLLEKKKADWLICQGQE